MTCPACGASIAPDARYCAACGRALTSADDERRVATVLFADLVGFTRLSERLDPEQVKNLVDRCFERLAAEVNAFGGRVDKIVGDAIVALFGAPIAHEDDAERAVRAGLRMQEVLDNEAEAFGHALQIRVGVNTGEVLVGAMRAAGSITAMGDVVNTAARLESAAQPGHVLVGPATYAATRRTIAYEHRGLISARGRDEPVETWQAIAPISTPGYRPRRDDVPIIGRENELGLLRHATQTSIANQRALLVLVVADVGMGKSRLVDEITHWAECEHEAVGREGRCLPYGEASIWWPVADALRDGFGVGEADEVDVARQTVRRQMSTVLGEPPKHPEVVRCAEGLLTLLGFDPPAGSDTTNTRQEATRALGIYIRAFSERRPLILQISDLHFADDAVLTLIDDVLAAVYQRPVVVLATARPTLLDRWTPRPGRHNTLVTHLDPLTKEASAQLLEQLSGQPIEPEVVAALIDRSGGNPFFIEELVSLASGTNADSLQALPGTLRGLIAARLDDLDPAARTVLQHAAVIGQRGPVAGLTEMTRQMHRPRGVAEAIDVDAVLDRLAVGEILERDAEGWWFRSDLVREVAYQTITKTDRARSHLGIALYLEAKVAYGEKRPGWAVDQLAHHYGTAAALASELGPLGRATGFTPDLSVQARSWIIEAAERAKRDQAMPAAVRLYGQALNLIGSHGDTAPLTTAELHLRRADAAVEAWDLEIARVEVERATALVDIDEAPALHAEALTVRGRLAQKDGDSPGAVALLTEASDAFESLGDHTRWADALRQRSMVEIFTGHLLDAQRSAEAAQAGFEQVGDASGIGWTHQNLAWIAFVQGDQVTADRHLQVALERFSDIGDTRGIAWALGLLAWVRFQAGRVDEAAALGELVLDEAGARSDPWATAMMNLLMASVRTWTGRTTEAVTLARQARRQFEVLGDAYGLGQSAATLGRALVMTGLVDEGFDLLTAPFGADHGAENGADRPPDPNQPTRRVVTTLTRLAAALQIGEPERAVEVVPSIVSTGGGWGDDAHVLLGVLALQRGDLDAATAYLDPDVPSDDPSRVAAQALWLALSGRTGASALASRLGSLSGTTYLDRTTVEIAAALESAVSGDAESARCCIDEARRLVSDTDDKVAEVVVALAAVEVARRTDDPDVEQLHAHAVQLADSIGIRPHGWIRLLGLRRTAAPVA